MNNNENKNQQQTNTSKQQQNVTDERDQKIKNEQDTARLRSERQSVIDGEKKNNNKK